MDPQKQKQMINQMYQSSAKSEEEIAKMTPEEKKLYLQSRLKQKMFFSTAKRQSNFQKEQMQEKMQEKLKESSNKEEKVLTEAQKERIRRKRQKKKEKVKANTENENKSSDDDDVVIVKDPNAEGSESDYNSD